MCYKSEANCFINKLYDLMEVDKERGRSDKCGKMVLDQYMGELDKLCRGLGCLTRVFKCEMNCDKKNVRIPCIPHPICLKQIYEECPNDPEADKIMLHLLEKLRREAELAENKYFKKELIKEIQDFYFSVAAIPLKGNCLTPDCPCTAEANERKKQIEGFELTKDCFGGPKMVYEDFGQYEDYELGPYVALPEWSLPWNPTKRPLRDVTPRTLITDSTQNRDQSLSPWKWYLKVDNMALPDNEEPLKLASFNKPKMKACNAVSNMEKYGTRCYKKP